MSSVLGLNEEFPGSLCIDDDLSTYCHTQPADCPDSRADNYEASFNTPGPTACVFLGCMNSLDSRYSSIATISDGSCPDAPGCADSAAANYNPAYNVQVAGSCTYGGCMTLGDANYSAQNTFAIPGSCVGSGRRLEEGEHPGCLDPTAYTFYAWATSHDQSMCTYIIAGCTDPNAFNYMPAATPGNAQASSACIARVTGCMSPTALNYDRNANTAGTCTYAQSSPWLSIRIPGNTSWAPASPVSHVQIYNRLDCCWDRLG
eukprot:jgi/Chrpa1/26998/Chrysochromulina_OHIO_Genome00028030-RA